MADVLELQMVDKIAEMLKDIKTSNNYLNTVREVNKIYVSAENIGQRPAVNVLLGDVVYSDGEGRHEAGRLIKKTPVILDVYYEANDNEGLRKTKAALQADLEIRFGDDTKNGNADYHMDATAYNLENTCLVVNFVDCTVYDMDSNTSGNFELTLDVYYRQKRNDPTTQY